MKKNILKIAFVVAIAIVSGINVFNAQKSNVLSDIALANVEALADYEMNSELCSYCPGRECVELNMTPSGSSHRTWYDQINKTYYILF